MSTVTVTGLQVISVFCSDLQKSKNFYIDHLGFKQMQDMPPGVLLSAGELTVYLEPGRQSRTSKPLKFPEVSPCFDCGSVKEAFRDLKDAGITIVSDYVEYGPQFAMFKIADPDGNVIEFGGNP